VGFLGWHGKDSSVTATEVESGRDVGFAGGTGSLEKENNNNLA